MGVGVIVGVCVEVGVRVSVCVLVTVCVRVFVCVRVGVGVFVAVADSGKGVDSKIEPVMFEAFMTTKPKGMGLGLALARKYLEGNGGSVAYETGPKGSTFKLILPKA